MTTYEIQCWTGKRWANVCDDTDCDMRSIEQARTEACRARQLNPGRRVRIVRRGR